MFNCCRPRSWRVAHCSAGRCYIELNFVALTVTRQCLVFSCVFRRCLGHDFISIRTMFFCGVSMNLPRGWQAFFFRVLGMALSLCGTPDYSKTCHCTGVVCVFGILEHALCCVALGRCRKSYRRMCIVCFVLFCSYRAAWCTEFGVSCLDGRTWCLFRGDCLDPHAAQGNVRPVLCCTRTISGDYMTDSFMFSRHHGSPAYHTLGLVGEKRCKTLLCVNESRTRALMSFSIVPLRTQG